MTDLLQTINDQLEQIPFFQDIMDEWNDYAEENFQTRDPYFEDKPDGFARRLKLPANASKNETKAWKRVQKRAWLDDRCFLGCYPVDCGIGLAPIVVLIPVVGPILMYAVHARLIHQATQTFNIDAKTLAKLEGNIFLDLLITLPPLIGTFLGWLNACSTRNAAMIHTMVTTQLVQRAKKEVELAQQTASQRYGYNRADQSQSRNQGSNTYKNTKNNQRTSAKPVNVNKSSLDSQVLRNETAFVGNRFVPPAPPPRTKSRGYPSFSKKAHKRDNVDSQQQEGVYTNIV